MRGGITSLPMTFRPWGCPLVAQRHTDAGATCATTMVLGSASASKTSSMLVLMLIAPVGHTTRHRPQLTQLVSAMVLLKAGVTLVLGAAVGKVNGIDALDIIAHSDAVAAECTYWGFDNGEG